MEHRFLMESASTLPLSPLSRMMITRSLKALDDRDYINALEYSLTVASVDKHPDVIGTLAVTVIRIAYALKMVSLKSATKKDIIDALSRNGSQLNYSMIASCFNRKSLIHVLELTRDRVGKPDGNREPDAIAQSVVGKIEKAVIGTCSIPEQLDNEAHASGLAKVFSFLQNALSPLFK